MGVNFIGIIVVTIIVIGIGGGGFALLWKLTRPPKMNWKARVYQLGEGVKPPIKGRDGKIVSDVKLCDLRPYTIDIIEKIEKAPGITIYRLVKLNKTVPAVTNDCVDYWGEKNKEVTVLIDGESCTLLKKGYDVAAGVVFSPMPYERTTMIKSEMAIRKDRLRKEKDILQAITPWIVAGICMLGLCSIAWIMVDGNIEISENNKLAAEAQGEAQVKSANILAAGMKGQIYNPDDLGDQNTEVPPSVE